MQKKIHVNQIDEKKFFYDVILITSNSETIIRLISVKVAELYL